MFTYSTSAKDSYEVFTIELVCSTLSFLNQVFSSILFNPISFTMYKTNSGSVLGRIKVRTTYLEGNLAITKQATPNPPFIIGGNSHPSISTFFFIKNVQVPVVYYNIKK